MSLATIDRVTDLPLEKRQVLLAFMEKRIRVDVTSGCWVWTGDSQRGYGRIFMGGHLRRAHRVSYEFHVGKIPVGMGVLHKCDNPICVNPAHLFIGDQAENMRDCKEKGRLAIGDRNGGGKKLSEQDAKAIRARLSSGETQKKLAREYGVSTTTVYDIVRKRCWAWL